MPIQLRQLCLVTQNLEKTLDQFETVFGVGVGFIDDEVSQFGARNAIVPIGTNFIEFITPLDPLAPSRKFLDRKGGDAGYMVITQVKYRQDQQKIKDVAAKQGVRSVFEITARNANFLQWHPADCGGSFLETTYDFREELEGHWDPAGGVICNKVCQPHELDIKSVGITTPDPVETSKRWAELTLSQPENNLTGNPGISLNNATVYFMKPDEKHSSQGLNRVHLSCPDKDKILDNAKEIGLPCENNSLRFAGVSFYLG